MEKHGWKSNFSDLPEAQVDKFKQIETRLRLFEKPPYPSGNVK